MTNFVRKCGIPSSQRLSRPWLPIDRVGSGTVDILGSESNSSRQDGQKNNTGSDDILQAANKSYSYRRNRPGNARSGAKNNRIGTLSYSIIITEGGEVVLVVNIRIMQLINRERFVIGGVYTRSARRLHKREN